MIEYFTTLMDTTVPILFFNPVGPQAHSQIFFSDMGRSLQAQGWQVPNI